MPCRPRFGSVALGVLLVFAPNLRAGETPEPPESLAGVVSGLFTNSVTSHSPVTNAITASSTQEISSTLRESWSRLETTNLTEQSQSGGKTSPSDLQQKMELARRLRISRQGSAAIPTLISLLRAGTPDSLQRTALLELALIAQDENQPAKALQIFAQYLARWPDDPSAPEILLREGLLHRQIGLNQMALTKFYAVMSTALVLKSDQFDYYRRLVIQAQTEIAETYYLQGKHQDAVEFLARLLKADHPALNKSQVHFKLIRSLDRLGRHDDVVAQGQMFLERYTDAPELPEVRFHIAASHKALGHNNESLQQVLRLLHEQQLIAKSQPQVWAYWQQRAGNEIANQFYREGNFAEALTVYEQLSQLDTNAHWQVPVWYQMGISYERLEQPAKATQIYDDILGREKEATTNAAPHLKTVFEMARWRKDLLRWQSKAEAIRRDLKSVPVFSPTNGPPTVAARLAS